MNIKSIYLILLLLMQNLLCAQSYDKIDSLVNTYPKDYSTIDDLVIKINSDFSTESDKSRAAFYWICKNISYDVEFAQKIASKNVQAFAYKSDHELIEKEKIFITNLALSAFTKKTAVCHGFSALFFIITNKLGLECKLIKGNLKSDPLKISSDLETNHGWNVIKINNEWKFVDCTLGAGNISSKTGQFVFNFNDIYFFTTPKLFFLNHFPVDEKWLLLNNARKDDYVNGPVFYVDFIKYFDILKLPSIGKISQSDVFEIKYNLVDSDSIYLDYSFSSENKFFYVELDNTQNNFTVPIFEKSNQILSLFINRRHIASYVIVD